LSAFSVFVHRRGTCPNDLTERSKILEERLLHALQEAVLRPDVVDYTLTKLEAELKARLHSMSADLEALRRRKHTLEGEIKRLTDALASARDSRQPSAVISAINERGGRPVFMRHRCD
jgi:septal ring factor EnvC (AmiA/AmiB activator)